MKDNERFNIEKEYLLKVQKRIEEEKVYQNKEFEEIPNKYKGRYAEVKWGDEDLVKHLQDMIIKRLSKLKKLELNPYFGRIDFQRDGSKNNNKIYIGKTTITDENNNILTTDWRTPVCTLYYDQSIGNVQYQAPEGIITGKLNLKSQIFIKDGKLVSVRDTDLVTDDELLVPFLTTNADARLKNIVASIQAEQNAIIRRPLNDNIIVQGVAGSGKTTVALHRAAYLIYNEDKYTAENFIIIGPNKYFLNYISALLPDLDTENISQFTFDDFSTYFFDDKISIVNSKNINNQNEIKVLKAKTSIDYKNAIDTYISTYVNNSLSSGIEIDGMEIISEDSIKSYFRDINGFSVTATNIQRILIKKIKEDNERLYELVRSKYKDELSTLPNGSEEKRNIMNKLDEIKKELKTGCSKTIKNYFKPLKITTLNLYKNFVSNVSCIENLSHDEIELLKKQTLNSIKSKKFYFEDLPSLMYIDILNNGNQQEVFKKYAHVIVDEAQDLGMFHYYILKMIFSDATFSIFGDLAQSIYPSRGVDSWEDVQKQIFNSNCEILQLSKSYRTTMEITRSANQILRYLNMSEANPVIRTGTEVEYMKEETQDINTRISELLYQYSDKDYKSVGIICRNVEDCAKIKLYLDNENFNTTLITSDDSEYNGGICILTSELSKGLEFDGVIITNASEQFYSSTNQNDMKLLYVAMTRALHSLDVLYTEPLTKPLSTSMIKNADKSIIKK